MAADFLSLLSVVPSVQFHLWDLPGQVQFSRFCYAYFCYSALLVGRRLVPPPFANVQCIQSHREDVLRRCGQVGPRSILKKWLRDAAHMYSPREFL